MRCRYIEAYQVDRKLQCLEQNIISNCMDGEVVSRIKSTSQWRAALVDKCLELLPEVQRQQLISGNIPDIFLLPAEAEAEASAKSGQSNSTRILPEAPFLASSLVLPRDVTPLISKKTSAFSTGKGLDESSILHGRSSTFVRDASLLHAMGPPTPSSLFNYSPSKDNLALIQTPGRKQRGRGLGLIDPIPGRFLSPYFTPLKELNKSPSRMLLSLSEKSPFQGENISLELMEWNSSVNYIENSHPSSLHSFPAVDHVDRMNTPSNHDKTRGMAVPGKRLLPDRPSELFSSDRVDVSPRTRDFSVEDFNPDHGPRWRSDETSEDEEDEPSMVRNKTGNLVTPKRIGRRRSRFYS